jgi:predicted metal-dependent hydrolase
VVHELAHLVHPDHSARFWRKVAEIIPDHPEHKRWLKEHRLEMILPK